MQEIQNSKEISGREKPRIKNHVKYLPEKECLHSLMKVHQKGDKTDFPRKEVPQSLGRATEKVVLCVKFRRWCNARETYKRDL